VLSRGIVTRNNTRKRLGDPFLAVISLKEAKGVLPGIIARKYTTKAVVRRSRDCFLLLSGASHDFGKIMGR